MIATAPALRWYQDEAVAAFFDFVTTKDGAPLLVLPTGAGKSLTMASIIDQARANAPLRVAIVATAAELVKQNVKAARLLADRADVGIYSAGLGEKDASRPITVANIQSLAKQSYAYEPWDLILIDEAHQIADTDTGLYRTFIDAQRKQNPALVLAGLTATPYKLSSGLLYGQPSSLFSAIAYEAPVLRLIEEGFLCRPTTPHARYRINTEGVALRGGEFVPKALAEAVDVEDVTEAACLETIRLCHDRKHWLIFAISIQHAKHIAETLERHGVSAAVVHSDLEKDERAHRLHAFEQGDVRALVNVSILTTGYDFPAIDAVVLMRPTKSAGLYSQMVGRGLRVHPSKTDCLIVDLAQLVTVFGPIDAIRVPEKNKGKGEGPPPAKLCPVCEIFVAAGVRLCIGCGHEFPPPAVVLETEVSKGAILSTDQPKEWIAITSVQYNRNEAKAPKTTPTLRVDYYAGYRKVASEWVCVEHDGFARSKAESWWSRRSPDRCPFTVDDALALTDDLLPPLEIAIGPDPKNPQYTRIADYRFASTEKKDGGLPRACWSCGQWANRCLKWNATPPADVQAIGCDDWTEEDTLPF
jgi:DNA repair protein RadD